MKNGHLINAIGGGEFFGMPVTALAQFENEAQCDIIVTATRRDQALQHVPLAVPALAGWSLRGCGLV